MNPEHGTPGGYKLHRRRRDLPCEPCCAANADYRRGRRIANGGLQHLLVPPTVLAALLESVPLPVFQAARRELGRYTVDAVLAQRRARRRHRPVVDVHLPKEA